MEPLESESDVDKDPKHITRCEVCKLESAKYTCPRCSLHTCSLPCVVKHKEDTGCDGKRDPTAFVAKKDFTEAHLRSDLHFLEELKRDVENLTESEREKQRHKLSFRMKTLIQNTKSRNVFIAFMPKGMSRHEQNTTIFDFESQSIHWRVEWKFPWECLSFIDERLPDAQIIQDCVDRHVKEHEEQSSAQPKKEPDFLVPYTEQGGRRYKVLLKIFGKAKFCLLDKSRSLQWNLSRKRVVEFPTLYVVREECASRYHILSAEEEEVQRRQKTFTLNPWRGGGRGQRRGRGHYSQGRGQRRGQGHSQGRGPWRGQGHRGRGRGQGQGRGRGDQ